MPQPSSSTGTSHRPTREGRKSREQQQLRRENQSLTREVARLKKYLGKATAVRDGFENAAEPVEDTKLDSCGTQCPICASEESPPMREISIPIGVLLVCSDCQHRVVVRA